MAWRVASKSGLSSVGMMMAGDCFLSRSSLGRKTCSSRQDQDSLSAWRGGQEYPGPDAYTHPVIFMIYKIFFSFTLSFISLVGLGGDACQAHHPGLHDVAPHTFVIKVIRVLF